MGNLTFPCPTIYLRGQLLPPRYYFQPLQPHRRSSISSIPSIVTSSSTSLRSYQPLLSLSEHCSGHCPSYRSKYSSPSILICRKLIISRADHQSALPLRVSPQATHLQSPLSTCTSRTSFRAAAIVESFLWTASKLKVSSASGFLCNLANLREAVESAHPICTNSKASISQSPLSRTSFHPHTISASFSSRCVCCTCTVLEKGKD